MSLLAALYGRMGSFEIIYRITGDQTSHHYHDDCCHLALDDGYSCDGAFAVDLKLLTVVTAALILYWSIYIAAGRCD